MKIGATYEGDIEIYVVEIEGRGGDSVHDEFFKEEEDAIFASAIDGQNRTPSKESVMKFSDGTMLRDCVHVGFHPRPSDEAIAKLVDKLTPAQKILIQKKRH